MTQERVCVGRDEDYYGCCGWPVYAVRCPECGQMTTDYGEVSTVIDGDEHYLCTPCGEKVFPSEA